MGSQWGWREDNGDILGNKGIEGPPTITLKKKVWGQENRCFIDPKKEAKWICYTTISWFWWEGKYHNPFVLSGGSFFLALYETLVTILDHTT
jgi:hypothetical protein